MKIVVCVKVVPDSAAAVQATDGKADWGGAKLVINPWDEYAVEAALKFAEAGGEVVALTMGDENAKDALTHALAMGCNSAYRVEDAALAETDSQGAAHVLAAAVQHIGDVDMVIFGKQAIDSDNGLMAAQTARVLGYPAVTLVAAAELDGSTLKVERVMEEGRQQVESPLPAVLSIVKDYGEPRYPSFMGIRKASKAEIPVLSLGDIGAAAPETVVVWNEVLNPPVREITNEMISGGSPEEIAATLADKIMEEKVL